MPYNKLTPDALAIMATIIMTAPAKPANTMGTLKDCVRVARLLEEEVFRPPSPADVGKPPPPGAEPLRNHTPPPVNPAEIKRMAEEIPGKQKCTVTLTRAEVGMLQRGLTLVNDEYLSGKHGDERDRPDWRSAWDKLYPLGVGA